MSDDRRLYEVEITMTMYVVATSEAEAEMFAEEHTEEELDNADSMATVISSCPSHIKETLPWGVPNDDPRRDWTVQQWLESLQAPA